MAFILGPASLQNREGIDQRLLEVDDLAITLTLVDYGHGPDSGLRTAARQNELYREGRSKADGYKLISNHQTGRALDFYAYVDGAASWRPDHLAMVAAAYLQAAAVLGVRIGWGGLWAPKKPVKQNGIVYGWDCPHVELLDP